MMRYFNNLIGRKQEEVDEYNPQDLLLEYTDVLWLDGAPEPQDLERTSEMLPCK